MEKAEHAILFTKGKEHFAPIQYFNFEVGPYAVELNPKSDETYEQMSKRAHKLLDEIFDKEFEIQLNKFLDRLEKTGEIVAARRKG